MRDENNRCRGRFQRPENILKPPQMTLQSPILRAARPLRRSRAAALLLRRSRGDAPVGVAGLLPRRSRAAVLCGEGRMEV